MSHLAEFQFEQIMVCDAMTSSGIQLISFRN
jgi:hypothetical protein